MIFEFIATITAGFACAGIALIFTHLASFFKFKTAKWLTPLFAAIGIFSFQIHQEYNWYDQTANQLPSHITVIKEVESRVWYKPWSYINPQIVRFIALDSNSHLINNNDLNTVQPIKNDIYLVNLYLFERRMSTKQVPQIINCNQSLRADYLQQTGTIQPDVINININNINLNNMDWFILSADDPLLQSVCA